MKDKKIQSVVQDWISELPFTQQAVLLLSLRGPDGMGKWNGAKKMTFYIRGVVLHAAYDDYDNSYPEPHFFMRCDYGAFYNEMNAFFREVDEMPHHYIMHTVHAAEIIGYHHPDPDIAHVFEVFYLNLCKGLHMNPETKEQLDSRLSK